MSGKIVNTMKIIMFLDKVLKNLEVLNQFIKPFCLEKCCTPAAR